MRLTNYGLRWDYGNRDYENMDYGDSTKSGLRWDYGDSLLGITVTVY